METRRDFLGNSGLAVVRAAVGPASVAASANAIGNSASLLRKNPDHPMSATYDRLPLGPTPLGTNCDPDVHLMTPYFSLSLSQEIQTVIALGTRLAHA